MMVNWIISEYSDAGKHPASSLVRKIFPRRLISVLPCCLFRRETKQRIICIILIVVKIAQVIYSYYLSDLNPLSVFIS